MIVRVRLFAAPRELAGVSEVSVELPDRGTIADLRTALAEQMPALVRVLPQCRFAVDADFAPETAIVSPTSEIACIPPVSGG